MIDIALKLLQLAIDLAKGAVSKNDAAERMAALRAEILAVDAAVDAEEKAVVGD